MMSKPILVGLCVLLCSYVTYGRQYPALDASVTGSVIAAATDPAPGHTQSLSTTSSSWVEGFRLDVRTNLLYDAFLTPTLGVEWRMNPHAGIKLDGSRSHWGSRRGNVQKIWLLSPEVRWYLLDSKRFYVGVGANFGEYNVYGGMIGGMFPDDTGYQGDLWGVGVTTGYQLRLSDRLSLDFNIGLGYTRFDDDSFRMLNKVRIYREKGRSTDFWGPTQAGISLVWRIGENR